MKHYIYGLVDPRDYKVRYVGRTSQRMDTRLGHHVGQAQRGNPAPVYAWLRSLLPARPWLVCLQTCTGLAGTSDGLGSRDAAGPAEVKWIKRFRRDCLNNVAFEQTRRTWQELVNTRESGL
jgi:hypothetical protein